MPFFWASAVARLASLKLKGPSSIISPKSELAPGPPLYHTSSGLSSTGTAAASLSSSVASASTNQ